MVGLFLDGLLRLQHLCSMLFEFVEESWSLTAHLNELLEEHFFIRVEADLELVNQLL
jgi:hypothetical protein